MTVSQKGWIVVRYGGRRTLVPVLKDPENEGFGALNKTGSSLLRGLEKARKDERAKEKRRK